VDELERRSAGLAGRQAANGSGRAQTPSHLAIATYQLHRLGEVRGHRGQLLRRRQVMARVVVRSAFLHIEKIGAIPA
jgi:hypothetical protein